jgi:Cu+-exporting ATPase
LVAITTGIYWAFVDSSKILPSVTAVLIVACPCSLLLSTTFTYGNMLRIFGKNKLYLKNAGVIESLAKINTIVFDKTGTITQNEFAKVFYEGTTLTNYEIAIIKLATGQSAHPLSRTINNFLSSYDSTEGLTLEYFKEYAGKGLSAVVDGVIAKIGSGNFVNQLSCQTIFDGSGAYIHILLDGVYKGFFVISNQYREGINIAINNLKENKYELLMLSGDNDAEKKIIEKLFASKNNILFNQSPQDKLKTIKKLQDQNKKVLMLGDGLNDAGALMQSDVGIAVSDHSAQFSPACDAIIDGSKIGVIHALLAYARTGKKIVAASFALSIVYNIVGLSFAVKGTLSPIVAAILMPTSSISIVLLVTFLSSLCARGLSKASKNESLSA